MALKLADAGANVALVDLGNPADATLTYNLAAQTELNRTVEEVKRRGVRAAAILADVTRWGDCQRMAARPSPRWAGSTFSATTRESSRSVRSNRSASRPGIG